MTATSALATLACGVVVASFVRPWRVRPRVPGRDGAGAVRPRACLPRLRPPDGALWGGAVVAAFVVHPVLGVAVLVSPIVRRARRRTVVRGEADRSVVRSMPEVIDLIVLGVGAGLTPRAALARCEAWMPPPFSVVFAEARRRAGGGESFVIALESASRDLGEPARPLINAIVAAEQTAGASLATFVRVGDEARRRRRVEAQERARRLPVTMLAPLVLCVLPAFGLLAVLPLLVSSLRDLGVGP